MNPKKGGRPPRLNKVSIIIMNIKMFIEIIEFDVLLKIVFVCIIKYMTPTEMAI